MPENHSSSSVDPATAEMGKKVGAILAELRKTQMEFAKYKEKHPKTTLSRQAITEFAQKIDSFNSAHVIETKWLYESLSQL